MIKRQTLTLTLTATATWTADVVVVVDCETGRYWQSLVNMATAPGHSSARPTVSRGTSAWLLHRPASDRGRLLGRPAVSQSTTTSTLVVYVAVAVNDNDNDNVNVNVNVNACR